MKEFYAASIKHYTKLLLDGLKLDGVLKENEELSASPISEKTAGITKKRMTIWTALSWITYSSSPP